MTDRKLNYLIDLHGVIDSNPNFFKKFTEDLIKNGNKVYICTGSRFQDAWNKLKEFNFKKDINFNQIFSISEILESRIPAAEIEYDVNMDLWVDDMLWWPTKGNLCKEHNINVIIDDSEEYFVYIPKNVVKLHYHQNGK